MTENEIITAVWQCFKKYFNPNDHKLYLFGSRATKKAMPFSDVDFIIKGPNIIVKETFYKMKYDIEGLRTLFTIDLVDYNAANSDFQDIVQKSMKEIKNGKIRP
ncbi:MAG: nucleotidyltransferase domain-containing protein [Deltaproteobacteria bacterium]|nr:nucleotidyltransferase domain-containing protein [Deltaproteobacteria bacterium]